MVVADIIEKLSYRIHPEEPVLVDDEEKKWRRYCFFFFYAFVSPFNHTLISFA